MKRDEWSARAATRATGAPAAELAQFGPALQPGAGSGSGTSSGRWGLVLGGGGVLGAAWLVGALGALEKTYGLDARDADLIVGTSAGSIVAAMLASGMSVAEQRQQQLGDPAATDPAGNNPAGTTPGFDPDRPIASGRPPRPRLRPGSTAILRNNRGRLRSMPATAVLTGLAPAGTARMPGVGKLIESRVPAGEWPEHPGLRVVALDYQSGRRVQFGAPEAPAAGLSEAVLASCAIPGWFAPVAIGGRTYVDGGAWSSTNADLVLGPEGAAGTEKPDLERLFVLAPMASTAYDTPPDWKVRAERRIRIAITRRCLTEARQVHAAGVPVTVLGPGPLELALIGHNLMAARPRRDVLRSAERTVGLALTNLHSGAEGAQSSESAERS